MQTYTTYVASLFLLQHDSPAKDRLSSVLRKWLNLSTTVHEETSLQLKNSSLTLPHSTQVRQSTALASRKAHPIYFDMSLNSQLMIVKQI